jgi:hypothetical protein
MQKDDQLFGKDKSIKATKGLQSFHSGILCFPLCKSIKAIKDCRRLTPASFASLSAKA